MGFLWVKWDFWYKVGIERIKIFGWFFRRFGK